MRLWLALPCALVVGCIGCARPPSSGGLWALDAERQELELYRVSNADRAAAAQMLQLRLADAALAQERTRLEGLLQDCPGPERRPMVVSASDRLRDGIRLWAAGDANRLAETARLALADWQLRRAAATGDAGFCGRARSALDGSTSQPAADDVLGRLPEATVARDPERAVPVLIGEPPLVALSSYALGAIDAVRAAAPLPQYLAAVYGGSLLTQDQPALALPADTSPEQLVDQLAPSSPAWEPDALFAAAVQQPTR